MLLLLALPACGALAAWSYGPYWIAPVDNFTQGPGGAVAYVNLYRQLQEQAPAFWEGKDIVIVLNQAEFSGMLSSALLSGRDEADPIRKVRAGLLDGEIRVETVLRLPYPQVPERYHGPIGLKLRLLPLVTEQGLIRFRINRATIGQIPVPPTAIKWAGNLFGIQAPGFDPEGPAILLPVGEMVTSQFGRTVTIKEFTADEGKLTLVVAMRTGDTN